MLQTDETTVGAGLLAKASVQTHRRQLLCPVRQQAGSCGMRSEQNTGIILKKLIFIN
jgi:hypothetical protein